MVFNVRCSLSFAVTRVITPEGMFNCSACSDNLMICSVCMCVCHFETLHTTTCFVQFCYFYFHQYQNIYFVYWWLHIPRAIYRTLHAEDLKILNVVLCLWCQHPNFSVRVQLWASLMIKMCVYLMIITKISISVIAKELILQRKCMVYTKH